MTTDRDIAALLAAEAEAAEQNEEAEESRPYRRPLPPTQPSQVYSVRIPVERLEELRAVAGKLNQRPTSLMREWILERLDEELGRRGTFRDAAVGEVTVVIPAFEGPHPNVEYLAGRIGDHILEKTRDRRAERA